MTNRSGFLSIAFTLLLALVFSPSAYSQTCVDIGGANPTTYTQNFDNLGNSPAPHNADAVNIVMLNPTGPRRFMGKYDNAANDASGVVNLPGWAVVEEGTNTSSVTGRYNVGDGTASGANSYSFASSSQPTDRAFGSLNDPTVEVNYLGACFRNTTGSTVTSLRIGFTGEMWRYGGSGTLDRLDFQYAVNANNVYDGAFIDFDALDFVTPSFDGGIGSRDGNVAPNRTVFPLTTMNVTLGANDVFYIRWVDRDIQGNDDGLAIDDFELRLSPPLAAAVSVTGRVVTAKGAGIAKARITLMAADGTFRSAMTNPFGYYRIDDVMAGQTYVLTVSDKRYNFIENTRMIDLGDEMTDVDFVGTR